ncbi:MAG: chromate efflux transporter [Kofleriaceae bacterium]
MTDEPPPRARLRDLAWVFLRLGSTAFGGPAAHISLMEEEVVRHRRWLTHERFLDLLGAAHLIPGPNSTEMAIHVGYDQAGWRGLLVAGACFIVPAMVIVMAIGWAYVRWGALPEAEALLYGVKPVIIAVIAQALWGLARTAIKSWQLAVFTAAAIAANALGVNEVLVLVATGAAAWAAKRFERSGAARGAGALAPFVPFATTATAGAVAAPFGLVPLFLFFLKVGAVLYGSGYVLVAFLRADLVERWHWITESQLLDAVAVGQVTPGPVFTTATFIGYLLGGPTAALVATLGIFLPAFAFVAASGPLVRRLRRSPGAGAFLDGVNVASLALMAVVVVQLGRDALVDLPSLALAAASAVLLIGFRVRATWLILGGAALGLARWLL